MGKGNNGGKKSRDSGRRWSEGHKQYTCEDRVDVVVASRAFRID